MYSLADPWDKGMYPRWRLQVYRADYDFFIYLERNWVCKNIHVSGGFAPRTPYQGLSSWIPLGALPQTLFSSLGILPLSMSCVYRRHSVLSSASSLAVNNAFRQSV